MTLEEAIYELNDLEAGDIELGCDKAAKAERLGIEALELLKYIRDMPNPFPEGDIQAIVVERCREIVGGLLSSETE